MDINTRFQEYVLAASIQGPKLGNSVDITNYKNRQKRDNKQTVYHRITPSTPQATAPRWTGVNSRDV